MNRDERSHFPDIKIKLLGEDISEFEKWENSRNHLLKLINFTYEELGP